MGLLSLLSGKPGSSTSRRENTPTLTKFDVTQPLTYGRRVNLGVGEPKLLLVLLPLN